MVTAEPLVVISPSRRWVALDLAGLWSYRELLYFLTWRDVKIRYKQTALGIGWALLQPLLTLLVFTILFGKMAKIPSGGQPYTTFVLAGILPWTFFANAVTASSNSLVTNANLIGKVYFPRLIMPAATVLAATVDLGLSFVLMFGLYAYHRVPYTLNILLLPALVLLTILLALAVCAFFSALNVKYRDVRYALPLLIQLAMYATPVIYPLSLVPAQWRPLLILNPMASVIEAYRTCLLGGVFDWQSLGIAAAATVAILVGSAFYFRSVEKGFADIL